jgi:secreted trypsin-like serine protease
MNLRNALAMSLVLAAASAAHANTDTDFIVGGTVVDANDPVASTTVLVTDGNYICTGSIIDTDLVVTAAHCVAAPAENLRIVFVRDINGGGSIDKSDVLPITGYLANPGWQGDNASGVDQHDIALIHLSGALPAGYHPATLLSGDASASLKKGESTELAGYGITNAATQDGAGTLREVSVKISKQLGQTEVVLDQRNGKGACHGDSGGPAFVTVDGQPQLWGVTNRGYPDNAPDDCKEYAVYTRIAAYADFLSQAAAQLRK